VNEFQDKSRGVFEEQLGDLHDQLRVTVKSGMAGSIIFTIGGDASELNLSSERAGTNLSMVAKSSLVLIGFET
jgi:hypothetical protein